MTGVLETKFGSMSGDLTVSVTDFAGITPTNIIRMNDQWRVTVAWHLDGFLASMLDGTWNLVLYMESLGPQPEFVLLSQDIDFSIGVGPDPFTLKYNVSNNFGPNNPAVPGVYKLVAVLTCKTPSGTPGPFAGFDEESPLLQFYIAP